MSVPPPSNNPPGGFNVPPSNVPPGGVYYGPPTNPPRSNNGCLKAFGITCGVLLLLGTLAVIFGGLAVRKSLSKKGSLLNTAMGVGTATPNGIKIQQAVVAYHRAKGKYPPNLQALVPDYLTDGKLLHSDLDSNSNPGHVSWTYVKPAANAPGSTPLLRLPYQLPIPGQSGPDATQPGEVVITLDGNVLSSHSDYRSGRRRQTF